MASAASAVVVGPKRGKKVARFQRFSPRNMKALREAADLSPERLALRLRVWELVEELDSANEGAGLVALDSYLGTRDLLNLPDEQIREAEAFLRAVLLDLYEVEALPGITGMTIRRWEDNKGRPVHTGLHAFLDLFSFDASYLFEPRLPERPIMPAKEKAGLLGELEKAKVKFRKKLAEQQEKRKAGRPFGNGKKKRSR